MPLPEAFCFHFHLDFINPFFASLYCLEHGLRGARGDDFNFPFFNQDSTFRPSGICTRHGCNHFHFVYIAQPPPRSDFPWLEDSHIVLFTSILFPLINTIILISSPPPFQRIINQSVSP